MKKKAAEKPREYVELQAKYAKMQELDAARYPCGNVRYYSSVFNVTAPHQQWHARKRNPCQHLITAEWLFLSVSTSNEDVTDRCQISVNLAWHVEVEILGSERCVEQQIRSSYVVEL